MNRDRRDSRTRWSRAAALLVAISLVGLTLYFCDTVRTPRLPQSTSPCSAPGEVSAPTTSFISTPNAQATEAGCAVLAQGGTAADAVVAAQYALGLTEPQFSGPGGGGIALYFDARKDKLSTFDGTVPVPDKDVPGIGPITSVGVPQTDRLMRTLHKRHGALSFEDTTAPAQRLATDGFLATDSLIKAIGYHEELFQPGAAGAFLLNDAGEIPNEGDVLRNPDYAQYLADLAERKFTPQLTEGDVEKQLRKSWRKDRRSQIKPDDALCVPYRDITACGSSSPSTGFMVVAHTLGILGHHDLAPLDPYRSDEDTPVARATAAHLMTEAERIAFANANTWMADAEANKSRAESYIKDIVTNPDHHRAAAESIERESATNDVEPLPLNGYSSQYFDSTEEGTSQISVRDAAGNWASVTTTLQRSFGSGIATNGFFLNNSLDNFSKEALPGQPNSREPGIKPRTMMAPVMLMRNDAPVAALGSPGGRKIPAFVLKGIVGLQDWALPAQSVVNMPNFGADNRNSVFVEKSSLNRQEKMSELFERWDQPVDTTTARSGLSIITADQTGADDRRGGIAQGVPIPVAPP